MGLFSVVGAGLVGLGAWGIPKLIENWKITNLSYVDSNTNKARRNN